MAPAQLDQVHMDTEVDGYPHEVGAGAAMLILGAIKVLPVLAESPSSLIAFVGFFVWIGFIVATSVVMLRSFGSP